MTATRTAPPIEGWLLGLFAGILGGLVVLSWGVAMPWFGVVAFLVGGLAPPRPFGLSGTLIGWGVCWIALFLRADAACNPASCNGPDITPWLVASGALMVAGVACLALAVAQHRPTTTD